ncbi:MAG: DNA polymerase sliding clamp [Desulfurococcaceae archaeon]|uniref:DNA polymerase sliding clamp n=1 Tax=Staphylothermus marinus TaxID=2280 RepID=A0A7C4JKV4_STAMA
MFKAIYPKASRFKPLAQAIAKISDEAPFYVSVDGLEIKTLSPDKTALLIIKLPAIVFEEFSIEDKVSFSVASSELNRVSRRAGRNDSMVMELIKENNVLRIGYRDAKTGIERSFYLNLLNYELKELSEPKIDFNVTVKMLTSDFKHIIRDVKAIGEEAVFHYRDNKLYVISRTMQKEYVGEFSEGNPLTYLSSTKDDVKASYSIDILEAAIKATAASKTLTIQFDQDKPMRIEFEIVGGGSLIYWIVPRVE